MKLPAKVVALFLTLILSLVIFAPFANAQTLPAASIMQTEANVPLNVTTLTQGIFFGMVSTATCVVGGIDYFSQTHRCLGYNPQKGTFGYADNIGGGLLGIEAGGIAALYTSPVHTEDYLQYMASNFGLVKRADASDGFQQLNPLTKLWITFRNLAYLFFVVIFVGVGFAIMMRAKIDPRTVMTIENQIPKLVVALLLISFSFAIAGLVIDFMWVSVYFIINLFAQLDPEIAKSVGDLTNNVYNQPMSWVNNLNNGFGGFLGIAGQVAGAVKDLAYVPIYAIFQKVGFLKIFSLTIFALPVLLSCAVKHLLHIDLGPIHIGGGGGDFGSCLDGGFANEFALLIAGIAFLIFAVAIFAALFKLWWRLLKCFTLFHVYVMFGPIMIMAGLLPGSKINFENWLRHIIAYVAVYPTAITIFLLAKTLMDVYKQSGGGFTPPLVGATPQTSGLIGPLLGFAIFMLAPSTVAMVQEALSAPDFKFLPEIGQGIAAGGSIVTGGWNRAIWDPLFRERNIATGAQAGLVRSMFVDRINDKNSNPLVRGLGRWFGYRRQGEKY